MTERTEQTLPQEREEQAPQTRDPRRTLTPPVDIFDTEEGIAVVADLPGAEKDKVNVDVERDILTIRAEVEAATHGDMIRREYELLPFFRQFQLSDQVDQDAIRAEMKYGVLTVHLPRVKEKQPRKIDVNVAQD